MRYLARPFSRLAVTSFHKLHITFHERHGQHPQSCLSWRLCCLNVAALPRVASSPAPIDVGRASCECAWMWQKEGLDDLGFETSAFESLEHDFQEVRLTRLGSLLGFF